MKRKKTLVEKSWRAAAKHIGDGRAEYRAMFAVGWRKGYRAARREQGRRKP